MTDAVEPLKARYAAHLAAFATPGADRWRAALDAFHAADAAIHVVHPFDEAAGPDAYWASVWTPMLAAFDGLHLRVDLLLGGRYEGADWLSATGYLVGHFARPFLGIPATQRIANLRWGAFHRIEGGRATETYVFLDLPELMMAAGVWPLPAPPGYAGPVFGPAACDRPPAAGGDPGESARSLALTTAMLSKLNTPDERWRPYWHPNMVWYGPAAFGSYLGVDRFAGFQRPFEQCFEGWAGGSAGSGRTRHFARFGDGLFTCSGGWPSLSGVSVKPFLGRPATGRMTFFRVCDWWRRAGDLLMENWVFVDIPHAMLQFGVDVFAGAEVPA